MTHETPDTTLATNELPHRRRRSEPHRNPHDDVVQSNVLQSLNNNGVDYDPIVRMRITDPELYRITMLRAKPEHLAAYRITRATWRRKARSAAAAVLGSWRAQNAYQRALSAAVDMHQAARLVMDDMYPAGMFSTLFGRS